MGKALENYFPFSTYISYFLYYIKVDNSSITKAISLLREEYNNESTHVTPIMPDAAIEYPLEDQP